MRARLVWYFENVPVEDEIVELGAEPRTFRPPGRRALHPSAIRLWVDNGEPWVTTDGMDRPLSQGIVVLTEWRPEIREVESPMMAGVRAVWEGGRWPLASAPVTGMLALGLAGLLGAQAADVPAEKLSSHVVEMTPEEYKQLTQTLRQEAKIVPPEPAKVEPAKVTPVPNRRVKPKSELKKAEKVAPAKKLAGFDAKVASLDTQVRQGLETVARSTGAAPTQLGPSATATLGSADRGGLGVRGGIPRGEPEGGTRGFGGSGSGSGGLTIRGLGGETAGHEGPRGMGAEERNAREKVCSTGTRHSLPASVTIGMSAYSGATVANWCEAGLPGALTWARVLAGIGRTA